MSSSHTHTHTPPPPSVADIMHEVRQGLSDNELSEETRTKAEQAAGIQASLRQAHEHAPILGRCGGSMSGRLCKCLSPLAKPVIEQINLFHRATLRILEQLAATSASQATDHAKIEALEQRLRELEERSGETKA